MNCSLTSEKREFIIRKLVGQLKILLNMDDSLEKTLNPLIDIKNNVSIRDLQQCHSFLLPDYDENCFCTEYNRAADRTFQSAQLLNFQARTKYQGLVRIPLRLQHRKTTYVSMRKVVCLCLDMHLRSSKKMSVCPSVCPFPR